jgi:hypothetical protein
MRSSSGSPTGFRTILPPRRIVPNLLAKSPREASELNAGQEQIMVADDLKPGQSATRTVPTTTAVAATAARTSAATAEY